MKETHDLLVQEQWRVIDQSIVRSLYKCASIIWYG